MGSTNALDFGPAGGLRFSRNSGRSVTGEALGAIRYPSPFFDIAQTYMPASFKTMLRWCRFYFLTNPLVNATVYKMAAYAVSDLVLDTENDKLKDKWRYFFSNVLRYKQFEVEAGLDYNAYGNTFISVFYPFRKLLRCKSCRRHTPVDKQKYTFREFKFIGNCQSCNHHGVFDVVDHHVRSVRDIRLIRWNPEYITIQHNDATGENRYYYTIPATLANDVRMAKRSIIERLPQVFIEALRKNKALLFSRDNIYHMKRPTIAQKDKGWGMPMILPVLKDVFYLQILRKAQEAIAIEHIVPMRVLFPQVASGSADIYSTVNLTQWRDKIEQEVVRWRLDNNYIPILPIPVGQQTLGGDGKALMLSQEYRVWAEHIVAGMGVPIEFVFGGMQYSGSNVSMRILENMFLDQRSQRLEFLTDFLIPNVSSYMGWEPVDCHYKRFKMADDLQRSAFYMQLNQAGKISDQSMLEDSDWDAGRERERIAQEHKHSVENQRRQSMDQATIQGQAQLIMAKYQARGQKALMEMSPEMGAQGMPSTPPMPGTGTPGHMSPNAEGQMMGQQAGQASTSGQLPGMEIPPLEGGNMEAGTSGGQNPEGPIPGAESQLQQQGSGVSIEALAQRVAQWVGAMPEAEQQGELVRLRQNNPKLYTMVAQLLQAGTGAEVSSAGLPAPEQRSPRRGPEATVV